MNLIVTAPFAGYARGERITDAATITAILESEHELSVVKVSAEAEIAAPPAAPSPANAANKEIVN